MFKALTNFFRGNRAPDQQRDLTGGQLISFGRTVSDSGEAVTPETILSIPTVNACVRLISEDMASLPTFAYRRETKGRQRDMSHNVTRLVHDSPNDQMSAFDFKQAMFANLKICGSAAAYIERVNTRPEAMWPLNPLCVKPVRKNGNLFYKVKIDGMEIDVDPANMFYMTDFTTDGVNGKSVLEQCANVFGVSISLDKWAAKFYANGMAVSGFVRPTGKMTKESEATLLRTIKENWTGTSNAYRIGILPLNTEWQPVGITPEQGQVVQIREQRNKEICRLYRINPIKVGERGNNSSMEHVAIDHATGCLRPLAMRFEAEANRKLFSEAEKPFYYVEMELNGMMRGDSNAQDNSFAKGIQNGWYSVNDVRRMKNEPEIEGGDVYLSPLNMTPAPSRPENQPQQKETTVKADGDEGERSLTPVFEDTARRVASKISNAVTRQATKTKELGRWLDEYLSDKEVVLRQTAEPVLASIHGERSLPIVDSFIDDLRAKLVDDITDAQAFDAVPQFCDGLEDTIRQLLEGAK